MIDDTLRRHVEGAERGAQFLDGESARRRQRIDGVPIVRLARAAARMEAGPDLNLEIEQAVLGALLLDGGAIERVRGLTAAHFALDDHRKIFSAITDCHDDSGIVDQTTVADRLRRNGNGDGGTLGYLSTMMERTPSAANVHRYAALVRDQAQRREIAALGAELHERASSPRADIAELRRDVVARLASMRQRDDARASLDWRALATQEAPARRWAIRGWLGFGHTTLIVGPGGIGKTLLAQQIEACLALGRPFIDDVPGPLRVLAWHCEDDHDELWRRQAAIARWLDAKLDSFTDKLFIVPRHGLDNALIVTDHGRPLFTPLLAELRQQAGDLRAEAVVLDNAAQIFGASENDRHAVTMFLNALAGALPGRAVLLLAHPARSVGSEFSGSSAWENVARTRLYLGSRLPDVKPAEDDQPSDDERYLSRRKANYSPKDWRRFSYRDGVLVPDAVEAGGGIVEHLRDQRAERTALDGLRRLAEMGLTATDGTTSPRYLPRLLTEYKLADGRSRSELAGAMRRLMLDGTLRRVATKGNDRHPLYALEAT